jgi:hypothetical protein
MAIIPQTPPTTYIDGICTGYTAVSELFTFNVDNFCNRAGVTQYQVMWLNRYGHYDYYTFTAGKDEGLNISRQTYKQWNVDWGSDNPVKTSYSRGTTDFQVEMTEVHIINSGFINEADMVFLEELYTSNDVYEITENQEIRPISILNAEFTRKNKGNRTIVNLELQYAYSNNIRLLGK